MREYKKFYINGAWVEPAAARALDVVNPATEEVAGVISLGSSGDVDIAVAAARAAFESWSTTPLEERLALLGKIIEIYQARASDLAAAVTEEMGAPKWLAEMAQVPSALAHLGVALEAAKSYAFEEDRGAMRIAREPVGVCGFITPWNWPLNQLTCKFAPAFVTGCTMVHKPSEIAPFSSIIFAEIIDEAGVPAGVYNLVNGEGPDVGAAIAGHDGVDMVSFTGSTRAGVEVARTAAPSVKRVHQELGGKSPNILLDDADMANAVSAGVSGVMMNSGQSCNAPTRMLVPRARLDEVKAIAKETAQGWAPGAPADARMGPVVSETQWNKIQALIEKGVSEGAELVTGGAGKPDGLETGYFVKPTVFVAASNDLTIAREEIFGPVLCIIPYDSEDDAVAMANDTEYGLAAYVSSGDIERARKVARRLRAGQVNINNAGVDFNAPFGGYKRSGNGREWGPLALDEFVEVKAMLGHNPAQAAE